MIDSTVGCCIPYPVRYTTAHYDSRVKYKDVTYQHLVYDFGSCLIREKEGVVYVIGTDDSTERVLYNFNLKLNDTLRNVYPYDTYTSWVAQTDSTQLYGTWYKVWHFNGTDDNGDSLRSFYYNVIEGIGCTNGVYYPASPYALSAYSDQLLCFTNDMGFTTGISNPVTAFGYGYTSSFDNSTSCSFVPVIPVNDLSTKQLSQPNPNSTVIPNPINETGKIIFPYHIQSGTLVILNEIGQTITNTSFQNKEEILIGDQIKTPGIYFYRVTDNQTGKAFSGKFVNP